MSAIRRLSLPMLRPEDVIPCLGAPTHWKQGCSAKSLADSWFHANDVPPRVRSVLNQSDDLLDCELVDAWLERETDLGDRQGRHSQTDLLAILGLRTGLAVLGIEAKVTESFGPLVSKWLAEDSLGKRRRLAKLSATLGMDHGSVLNQRYQLLHRTVAVVLEAKRYRTNRAIVLVQSFCPHKTGFDYFSAFVHAMGYQVPCSDRLTEARRVDGITLSFGWVSDEVPEDLSWTGFLDREPCPDFPEVDEKYGSGGKLLT